MRESSCAFLFKRYDWELHTTKKYHMGRYLCVGIATAALLRGKDVEKHGGAEKCINELRCIFPESIYYVAKRDDGNYIFGLRGDLFKSKLVSFLHDFYEICFQEGRIDLRNEAFEIIAKAESWDDLFGKCEYDGNEILHFDRYWDKECIYLDYESVYLPQNGLTLATSGKISMEWYGAMFDFFQRSIAKNLEKHELSKAIRVVISG